MRRSVLLAWGLFLVFMTLTADSAMGALPVPYGGKLRVGLPRQIGTVLPAVAVGLDELVMARQLSETLVRVDADGDIEPVMLLKAPETKDTITWELSLKPNLKDRDGYVLDAAQVVASWERLLDPATGSMHWWLLAAVDGALDFRQGRATKVRGLTVMNPLKLRVKLAFPLESFPEAIAAAPAAPMTLPRLKAGKITAGVGTGPFLASGNGSGVSDSGANVGHCRGRPFLDRVEWIDCSKNGGCRLGWKAGRIDVLIAPGASTGAQVVSNEGAWWPVLLRVNPDAFQSRQQARDIVHFLDEALDRPSLARYAAGEWGVPMYHLLDFEQSGSSGGMSATPVSQAPFPSPPLDLLFDSTDPLQSRLADKLQVLLFDLGIPTTLVGLQPRTLIERIDAGDFGLAVVRPFVAVKDTVMRMAAMIAWSCPKDRCAAIMEELVGRVVSLPDAEQRRAVLRQIGRSYTNRLYVIPLLRHKLTMAVRKRVKGMRTSLSGLPDLSYCWLEQGDEDR